MLKQCLYILSSLLPCCCCYFDVFISNLFIAMAASKSHLPSNANIADNPEQHMIPSIAAIMGITLTCVVGRLVSGQLKKSLSWLRIGPCFAACWGLRSPRLSSCTILMPKNSNQRAKSTISDLQMQPLDFVNPFKWYLWLRSDRSRCLHGLARSPTAFRSPIIKTSILLLYASSFPRKRFVTVHKMVGTFVVAWGTAVMLTSTFFYNTVSGF